MKTFFAIANLLLAVSSAFAATNNSLTDEQLLQIKFDQKIGVQVPLDLNFLDEAGKQVQLGDYFGKKPVVLMLGYFECPMLCTLVLNGAVDGFQGLKWTVGEDFDVMFVSIDPKETPELATRKREMYFRSYGRGTIDGWHFLSGDNNSIHQLADEVGFHYAYDPAIKQYAHPSGLIILTPDGKVSRYFFGVTYSAKELNTALRDAGGYKTGSPVQQLILLCFHYSPLTGKYANLTMFVVRAGGILTVVGMAAMIFMQPKRRKGEPEK
jgi:protein SCO1/2